MVVFSHKQTLTFAPAYLNVDRIFSLVRVADWVNPHEPSQHPRTYEVVYRGRVRVCATQKHLLNVKNRN